MLYRDFEAEIKIRYEYLHADSIKEIQFYLLMLTKFYTIIHIHYMREKKKNNENIVSN